MNALEKAKKFRDAVLASPRCTPYLRALFKTDLPINKLKNKNTVIVSPMFCTSTEIRLLVRIARECGFKPRWQVRQKEIDTTAETR